jgi:hypothetical protein
MEELATKTADQAGIDPKALEAERRHLQARWDACMRSLYPEQAREDDPV